jgi:cation diffusion facilitator CzcD-associated flavoprotein CzcO
MGSKRVTPSDEYSTTYNKPFVKLVTDTIETFTKEGIKTTDQKEYKFDTVLFATGFDMIQNSNPFEIVGQDGKQIKEVFGDTPMAYMGCTHSNLPNFFFLNGPGTGLGHSSMIYMIECQADYAIDGITKLIKLRAKSLTLKKESLMTYWDWSQKQMKDLVFGSHSPVTGWYRNAKGVNWTLYPAGLIRFWWTTRSFNLLDYEIKY